MTRRLPSLALRLLSLVLALLLAIGLFSALKNGNWLKPFGIESQSRDSQVIRAIERTQEISLLSLAVQGLKEKDASGKFLGKSIPGTGKKVFLQYEFDAKLGLDGAKAKVERSGEHTYRIAVPAFKFIGYDKPTFKVAVEDGGVLGWTTPDIDKVALVNEILNDGARDTYLADNQQTLQDQTKVFYDGLIKSIDPAAVTAFEFTS